MPQEPSSAYIQTVTEKLMQCGLRTGEFTVKYEDELQSVEIVIDAAAGIPSEQFECIRQAAGREIVTFRDPELQEAYQDQVLAAFRPKMLADARAELEIRGILNGFPERSNYSSDKLFAEALERQCGMKPGSFFVQDRLGLIGRPNPKHRSKVDQERLVCMMAAIMYVSAKDEGFQFGIIGNEALAPGK